MFRDDTIDTIDGLGQSWAASGWQTGINEGLLFAVVRAKAARPLPASSRHSN